MSTELKIIYADVESATGDMTSAATSLKPTAEPPITGNTLDVVTKLTELSVKLETVLTTYQTVLQANIATTTKSVQFMRESDDKVASGMQSTLPGTKQVIR